MEKSIDDIEFRKLVLKMHDEGNNIDDISEILNVKMWLIKSIIFTFSGCLDVEEKINSGKFTKEEDEFIKNNYNKDVSFFIKTLKRQYSCLNSKLFRVKKEIESEIETLEMDESYKPQNSGKKFTEEEIEFIKEAYESGDSIKDISIAMERSKHSIEHIIRNNKFKRKEEETRAKRKLENDRLKEQREKGTKEVEAALAQAPTSALARGEGKDSQSNVKPSNLNHNNQNNKKFNK